MKVRFYRQRPDGPELVGAISLINGVLIADPADSIALTSVLAEPLSVYQEDGPPKLINPKTHPKEFLKAMPRVYHGTYFWCRPVED